MYLHSNYFKPNRDITNILNVVENEKYVIMRFVSWNAHHDVGQKGLNIATKRNLIKTLSKYAKVFISSEDSLPDEFRPWQISISPRKNA